MILALSSSELTRYARLDLGLMVSLEHDTEESNDAEPKAEWPDSADKLLVSIYSSDCLHFIFRNAYTLSVTAQMPSSGICKIHLEPPDFEHIS